MFKFKYTWLMKEGFNVIIRDWWQSFVFRGSSSYVLMEKLNALKFELKTRTKEVFGRAEENKRVTMKKCLIEMM